MSCLFFHLIFLRLKDVRSLIKDEYQLSVTQEGDSLTYGWEGGKKLASSSSDFNKLVINKKTYEEHGHSICRDKFNI